MAFSININSFLNQGNSELAGANNVMNRAMRRLSTGYKINSASDDPAGYVMSVSLSSQIRGLKVAYQNTQSGYAMLDTADNALNDINDLLNRVRELGLMGANSVQTKEQRNTLQKEANEIVEEIYRIINYTKYGDEQILGKAKTATINAVLSAFSTPPPKL